MYFQFASQPHSPSGMLKWNWEETTSRHCSGMVKRTHQSVGHVYDVHVVRPPSHGSAAPLTSFSSTQSSVTR